MLKMATEFFSASLIDKINPDDVFLPLGEGAKADLLNILKGGKYIYLSVRSEYAHETVRVRNEAGTLIMDRGIEGTEPAKHHIGTCVSSISPTVVAMIKDLICNYDCCDSECLCVPVTFEGYDIIAEGQVGQHYRAELTFAGTLPMNISLSNAPSWVTAVQTKNRLVVSGTPDTAGSFQCNIAVTNCNGTSIIQQGFTISVKE